MDQGHPVTTERLTMAQALTRYLGALQVELPDGRLQPYCAGVFAIFGHGNVAGLGEALWAERATLPTYRAHNEQAMAHAAIAFAKARFRQQMMAVSTSIGPGATNLLTAAALAHVNRLPVLLLPGDVFASRAPDPVLQQLEDFAHGDVSANDAFRPLTRYFDRITRPEQILDALPRAIAVMTDPATCGPVCLALPQDVQTMAFDCPTSFLQPAPIRLRRPAPDAGELSRAAALLRSARRPLIVAGGGVLYSQAWAELARFAEATGIPVAETQAGKSSLPWNHPLQLGAIGVTGSPAANTLAREADLVLAVGTRLQDFTTGSNSLFTQARILGLNVQALDATKGADATLVADAQVGLAQLAQALPGWQADAAWTRSAHEHAARWVARVDALTSGTLPAGASLPYDADVIGAVRDSAADSATRDVVVCAAGTLPAELHKLWRAGAPGNYHMEYGYSCMGYEVSGALGVKLAVGEGREVYAMTGDGSFNMLHSELITSVQEGKKINVVLFDNAGYGCINNLQMATGNDTMCTELRTRASGGRMRHDGSFMNIDYAAIARAYGCAGYTARTAAELEAALEDAKRQAVSTLIDVKVLPKSMTEGYGGWWRVGVAEVSERARVQAARSGQEARLKEARRY